MTMFESLKNGQPLAKIKYLLPKMKKSFLLTLLPKKVVTHYSAQTSAQILKTLPRFLKLNGHKYIWMIHSKILDTTKSKYK